MKICMINPPNPFLADPKRQPPLGLLYIAAMFEKLGQNVTVLDYALEDHGVPKGFDLYAFTATTPQYFYAEQLAKKIRGAKIIGGPHVTSVDVDRNLWDTVVRGEGENAVGYICCSIHHARKVIRAEPVNDLDSLPFPARHLVSLKQYTREVQGKLAGTLICSRGCPFNCAFCDKEVFGGYRLRSVENVMMEIDHLQEQYGYEALQFLDDSITVNRKWILKLCRELKSRDLMWRCWTRVDIVDLELLKVMRKVGCVNVAFGIESGCDKILESMDKGTTVKQGVNAVKWAKEAGISVKAFLMAGFPTETEESIMDTIRFVEETDPDEWVLGTFTPIPGSNVWNHPRKYGIKSLDADFKNYLEADADGRGRLPFVPLNGSREHLETLRDTLLDYLKTRRGSPI